MLDSVGASYIIPVQEGLKALGLPAQSVVMVGDDIVSDVGGAQAAGVRGVLVTSQHYL